MCFKIFFVIVLSFYFSTAFSQVIIKDSCAMPGLPNIPFRSGKATISKQVQIILDSAIKVILKYPVCNVRVSSYGNANVKSQQLSWDRTNCVVKYLNRKGIGNNRIVFEYGAEGDVFIVTIKGTLEKPPPPIYGHPHMIRH